MTGTTSAALAAVLAVGGMYLLVTPGRPFDSGIRRRRYPTGDALASWMRQAGLGAVSGREFAGAVAALFLVGATAGYLLFDAAAPAVFGGLLSATFPVSAYRRRREARMEAAAEAWPRLLEEIRLRTGSLGRSVPQALFEVSYRVPDEWREPFAAAEREWLLTTDFARTVSLIKSRLADPTADVVCETLLLAHEVGGTDLDGRLADLIEDRIIDLQGRKDAASRQAGVRFARRFVLLVPLGMAVAGLTIGTGRQAYASAGGQVAVAVALASVAACWAWSGRLMRMPREPRVFR